MNIQFEIHLTFLLYAHLESKIVHAYLPSFSDNFYTFLITIVLKLDTSRLFMFITFTVFLNHLTHFLMTIVSYICRFWTDVYQSTLLSIYYDAHTRSTVSWFWSTTAISTMPWSWINFTSLCFVHYSTFTSITSLFAKKFNERMLQIHHQESVATKVIHNHCGVEYTETSRLKVI